MDGPASSDEARAAAASEVDRLHDYLRAGHDLDRDEQVRSLKARLILNHMFQFTGLASVDGLLLEANQTALDAGGIERDEVIGRPVWEANWFTVSEQTQLRLRQAIDRAVRTRELVRYDEDVYASAHGTTTVAIDFSARPVLDSHDEVAFLVLEGRDIGEKKQAERLKDQLFANVSHELRTPVTLILGRAADLEERAAGHREREAAARIADNARVLVGKVNDLLQVASLEGGGLEIAPGPVDLPELARWVASNFSSLAAERSARIEVDVDASVRTVTDATHLETILVNLVGNACRFVGQGGLVVISARLTDGLVELEVRDDGPGVPSEERERIFDPFHQLDRGIARRHQGTGLGLAIVRQLVELLEGEVEVTDAPEGGACFRVRLPHRPVGEGEPVHQQQWDAGAATSGAEALAAERRLDQPLSRPSSHPTGDGRWQRDHVLLVEDNTDLARFLHEQLSTDYRLSVARDGWEALDLLASEGERVDLIVTDVMMPRLGGDELVERLAADETLPEVPVLVLTAREDQQLRERLLARGASDYLVKPFSVTELVARLENLLAPVRLHRRLRQANGALERYARQVSHDLKTPLTTLVGFSETLLDNADQLDDAEQRRMLERIAANARRLEQLADDLLTDLRDASGSQPVPVGELLEEVTHLLAGPIEEHAAHIEAEGPLPKVLASRGAVRSVLLNLVENALHYRAADRPVRIRLSARRVGGQWEVAVRDNGSGIPPGDRERVFAPGDRGSADGKRSRDGTGHGLYGCRELLARYGGRIWIEPSQEPGTEVRFTLPAADPVA